MLKNRAAIGIQMHSGWGVMVVVSVADSVTVVDRRRIVVIDAATPGAQQPYHHARSLLDKRSLQEVEQHIETCATASEKRSSAAVKAAVLELEGRGYRIVGAAILQGAGRPLPPLPQILAAHPLIHTAEGEFFCRTARIACERLKIPVTGIRRRDLDEQAKISLREKSAPMKRTIANLGKSIGPPWTADHKAAALAAVTILARG